MGQNVSQKLISSHLVEGEMKPGEEIGLKIDQTLTQDATGTTVMLELESMEIDKVKTELSAQYVDHNLLQTDFKNADDHLFLRSACQKFGIWYSRAGNGVSHPVHMERFGIPGKTLLGSDSHTPAAGSLGMLAMGAGGLEVALAMAGQPYHLTMPKIMGVHLKGKIPNWVSAKDIILEMLRRHTVKGGVGWIIEFFGPGLKELSAMDRHVIANMGTELGATTTVFPSDEAVKEFLTSQGRAKDWKELKADKDAEYDEYEEIDLSQLEPLIALPSSPDKVVPVKEVAGKEIFQSMVGSSANPGYRDFAIAAEIVKGEMVSHKLSFDINPSSRQILDQLTKDGHIESFVRAGARIHEPGCNGCIGMGQAPATGRNSLRTVPRNFPGRSGTKEDSVFLCSPETAAASALNGVITDPRTLKMKFPKVKEPKKVTVISDMLLPPPKKGSFELEKGPNIKPLPKFDKLENKFEGPVLIKVANNISTDEIMPAGEQVLPYRSNLERLSTFVFCRTDETYYERAKKMQKKGHFIVGGLNYGQGSSREHAAMAPRYLGVKAVLAKSYARIHAQNLVNFGVVPLIFSRREDYSRIRRDDVLIIKGHIEAIKSGEKVKVHNKTRNEDYWMTYNLSERQKKVLIEGGMINYYKHHLYKKKPKLKKK
ncbi:MAG: aconitate hydratase [Chlamydiales bacterium]